MLSSNLSTVSIRRICGHHETEVVKYRSRSGRNHTVMTGRNQLCAQCNQVVKNWFDTPTDEPYLLEMVEISGTEAQVRWANSIRNKHMKPLFKVLAISARGDSVLHVGVTMVIYALCNITSATFWINRKELTYTAEYVALEAAYFLSHNLYGMYFQTLSVFAFMSKHMPYRLKKTHELRHKIKAVARNGDDEDAA